MLRAIMDSSAPSFLLADRPQRPFGSPGFDNAGKTVFSISSVQLADLGGKLLYPVLVSFYCLFLAALYEAILLVILSVF